MMQSKVALWKIGLVMVAIAVAVIGIRAGITWQFGDDAQAREGQAVTFEGYQGAAPSDEQLAALSDGTVTEDEVRAALTKAEDCLAANGVEPIRLGDPRLEGSLVLSWNVPDRANLTAISDIVRKCDIVNSASVTSAYRVQTRGSSPWNPVLPADTKGFTPPVPQGKP